MSYTCKNGHLVAGRNVGADGKCRECANARARARLQRNNQLPPETESVLSAYKEPLTKVKDGFGYYGTVTFDKTKHYTQCHICGFFQKHLTSHVKKAHKMSGEEYREKFGLFKRKSLIAPNERKKYLEQWARLTPEQKAYKLAILKANRSKGFHGKPQRLKSLEQKNVEGTCPDQLLDKIDRLAKKMGQTPTRREFEKEYGHSQALIQATFGTWRSALDILKLEPRKSGKVVYTEANVIRLLQDFKITNGREPYSRDLKSEFLPSAWTMINLFGSWSNAKKRAFGN